MSNQTAKVTGIILVGEMPWLESKETVEAIIRDTKLKKLIIVSTDSETKDAISFFAKIYAEKIIFIYEEKEKRRAFLLAKAVETAKAQMTDYVLFLDSNAVPEKDLIDGFLDNYKYFKKDQTSKIIMIANTIDIFGKEKSFYTSTNKKHFKDGTLFELFSFQKIIGFIKRTLQLEGSISVMPPVFKTQAFIGGGVFIPIEAIRTVEGPDSSLFIYGEDTDYAWRIKNAGFSFFQCAHPIIRKPSTEYPNNHHVFDLFNQKMEDYKVYYHIRNAILISRKNTYQFPEILFINIVTWILVALALGFLRAPTYTLYFQRVRIILVATRDGYYENKPLPHFITI